MRMVLYVNHGGLQADLNGGVWGAAAPAPVKNSLIVFPAVGAVASFWTIFNFYYVNGSHNQSVRVDIIFDYIFHVGLPGTCFITVWKIPVLAPASPAPSRVCLMTFIEDIFLEVRHGQCS